MSDYPLRDAKKSLTELLRVFEGVRKEAGVSIEWTAGGPMMSPEDADKFVEAFQFSDHEAYDWHDVRNLVEQLDAEIEVVHKAVSARMDRRRGMSWRERQRVTL